jgi:hypothetical protein
MDALNQGYNRRLLDYSEIHSNGAASGEAGSADLGFLKSAAFSRTSRGPTNQVRATSF